MPEHVIRESPWLYGVERKNPKTPLTSDVNADIAIVGGGIAGVSTAYFLLTRTNHSVTLIEQSRIADGASGNNAGTATPIFEKSLTDFVSIFGPERVKGGLAAIDDGWELLEEVYAYAEGMSVPLKVNGYFGYRTSEEVIPILSENAIRVSLGATPREVFFAEERKDTLVGPLAEMPGLRFISAKDIAKQLRTADTRFTAAVSEHEALINTASLCIKTVEQLLAQYPERFTVYEGTEVTSIEFDKGAIIRAREGIVRAKKVVMATNGFEKFSLSDQHGNHIDARFHKNVTSKLGYMIGIFIPDKEAEPASLAYVHQEKNKFSQNADNVGISFVYVTERPYVKDGISGALVTIGDPDSEFNHELADYSKETAFNRGVQKEMERFLEIHYGLHASDYERFLWHGLMGYTEKYARLVGNDPHVEPLYYNLGCNGVGILLSLWGGLRIAELSLEKELPPTMFDPSAHFV